MPAHRRALAVIAAGIIFPALAVAQTAGGVPPYDPPAPVDGPARDGQMMGTPSLGGGTTDFAEQPSVVAGFAQAYRKHGKPRLALYWNTQLSEALTDWYSDTRLVNTSQGSSSMSGDFSLNQASKRENSLEIQRRVANPGRAVTSESFDWEFQDAFIAPFLEAGATVVDRAAMIRLSGADLPAASDKSIEVRGLQGKADYLVEILVAPNWKSTTGYELRARVLDIKTGAIVATVNSKNLKEWNPEKPVLATEHGFVDPNDADDADEFFGPQDGNKYRATGQGFEQRRKPPKLPKIAQNLAYNTMTGLMRHWH